MHPNRSATASGSTSDLTLGLETCELLNSGPGIAAEPFQMTDRNPLESLKAF